MSAANSALQPTLRVVGYSPNVAYISKTVLLVARSRCNGRNIIIVNSITIAPIPSTGRLTRVTVYATRATGDITRVTRPGITVLDFSAGNDTGRRQVSLIARTLTVTGRVTPALTVSNRLRTSTTLIRGINGGGTPNDTVTKRTGILVTPGLRIKGVNCGLIRHLNGTITVKPVLRNVTQPIGSLSHNYSVSSVCCVITVATYRTVSTGTGRVG